MKCYVINLDRSSRRLEEMTSQFSRLGLDFVRVPAVEGESLAPEILAPHQSDSARFYALGSGEIACFMSHRRCWELIAEGQDSFGVVFEDDVEFGEHAERVLSNDGWIPGDADIVKLETVLTRTRFDIRPAVSVEGRTLNRLRSVHVGAGAYIVSRACASRLLAISRDFVDPVDQFLFSAEVSVFDTLIAYQMIPAICIQSSVARLRTTKNAGPTQLDKERAGKRRDKSIKFLKEISRPFVQLKTRVHCYLNNQDSAHIEFR